MATAAPNPTPTPIPGVDWGPVDAWFQPPDVRFRGGPVAVMASGTVFVAWGPTEVGTGIVVSSGDLRTWAGSSGVGQGTGSQITAMAAGPAGIVAVGPDDAGATRTWRSPDGMSWTAGPAKSGIDGTVVDIASYRGGYVAGGSPRVGCDVAVWLSDDGFAWRASEPLAGARGTCSRDVVGPSPSIEKLAVLPTGLVAYGFVPGTGSVEWTSPDGTRWTLRSRPSGTHYPTRFVVAGPGLVGVGSAGTSDAAAAWTSRDGVTWTRVPDQGAFHGAIMGDVQVLADGTLVAVGSDVNNRFAAWTSTDGLTWQRAPVPDDPSRFHLPGSSDTMLATDGRRLVAVGGGSKAWISPLVTHRP